VVDPLEETTSEGTIVHRTRAFTLALILLTSTACATDGDATATAPPAGAAAEVPTVTVHKTEACACCGQYEDYLVELGVTIEIELHDDIATVKDELGVPDDQRSCHTNEVAGYVVEGHVPVEAIAALLDEAPDVAGIALAGMPAGSPGMPGEQTEPFVVTTFRAGEVVGELGRF
jgi:hypothetical protein